MRETLHFKNVIYASKDGQIQLHIQPGPDMAGYENLALFRPGPDIIFGATLVWNGFPHDCRVIQLGCLDLRTRLFTNKNYPWLSSRCVPCPIPPYACMDSPLYFTALISFSPATFRGHTKKLNQTLPCVGNWARFANTRQQFGASLLRSL